MDIRRNGEHALILNLTDLTEVLNIHAQLQAINLPHIRELVPAARTITIHLDPDITPEEETAILLEELKFDEAFVESKQPKLVEIPTCYNGPDTADVAARLGLSPRELIDAHTGMQWRAAFGGFAPGFTYLMPTDAWFNIPRHEHPRPKIPAGSVGLAGEFSGVYPQASPGGWQLLGTTPIAMWDLNRPEPALIHPGDLVKFIEFTDV